MKSETNDIEKRKADIKARVAAGAAAPPKVAAKVTPTNDYGAYCKAERAAGRQPKSKADWADMLMAQSKARIKAEATGTPAKVEEPKKVDSAKSDKPAKATKPAKDANALSVSDIAKELGIEPKVARARLRKDGTRATDGRWPTVVRDSAEHKALVAKLAKVGADDAKAKAAKVEKKPDADEEAANEQQDADEQEDADEDDEE